MIVTVFAGAFVLRIGLATFIGLRQRSTLPFAFLGWLSTSVV